MKNNINQNVVELIDNLNKKNFGRNLFLFVMGMLISAMAFNLFFAPSNVVPTGSSGVAYLISEIVNGDVALILLLVNIILLFIGFCFF